MRSPAPLARFRAPANVQLRRAQLTLMLATLVPTVLMTALGIVLLAVGSASVNLNLVAGVLLVAFCTTSLTGYILGSIYVSRGALLARVQNDFVSSVSHELRTPLTSIRMFIDTLRDGRIQDEAEHARCLDLLGREVERLDGLVTRVIELSRIQSGRRPLEMKPVELGDVIAAAESATRAAALLQEVEITTTGDVGLTVLGDRSTLVLAVKNLLNNALKYSDKAPVEIDVSRHGKNALITVKDHGPGIPKDEQSTIFNQFERGQFALDGRYPGSGLGLAIVRAVVEQHKGRLELRTKPGQGSEFIIRLPLQESS